MLTNKARLVFKLFADAKRGDGTYVIHAKQLRMALLHFAVPGWESDELFRAHDTNMDGVIDVDEFEANFEPLYQFVVAGLFAEHEKLHNKLLERAKLSREIDPKLSSLVSPTRKGKLSLTRWASFESSRSKAKFGRGEDSVHSLH